MRLQQFSLPDPQRRHLPAYPGRTRRSQRRAGPNPLPAPKKTSEEAGLRQVTQTLAFSERTPFPPDSKPIQAKLARHPRHDSQTRPRATRTGAGTRIRPRRTPLAGISRVPFSPSETHRHVGSPRWNRHRPRASLNSDLPSTLTILICYWVFIRKAVIAR